MRPSCSTRRPATCCAVKYASSHAAFSVPGANAPSGAPLDNGCTVVPRGTSREGKIESQCAKPISRSAWLQVVVGRLSDAYGEAAGVVCDAARETDAPVRSSAVRTHRNVVMRFTNGGTCSRKLPHGDGAARARRRYGRIAPLFKPPPSALGG